LQLDDFQSDAVLSGLCRGLLAGVSLINEGQFDFVADDFLNLLG
jgi:hypothetical protein